MTTTRKKMAMSRREFLRGGVALGTFTALGGLWPSWMPRLAFAEQGPPGDVVVCIFLRGGADALNMVVPFGDDNYYRARPTLAIPRPDASRIGKTLALDDFFGLNPDMAPLHELFTGGRMTAVHAVGAPHISRSHFSAMNLIETGLGGIEGAATDDGGVNTGWLGRHLTVTASPNDTPLRAIGWDDTPQTSLRGYASAAALRSIADYHLSVGDENTEEVSQFLASMYQNSDPNLQQTANATLNTLATVSKIDVDAYIPANGAAYTETNFGRALKQTAALIKAEAGLEVACIDLGNFDTHITQGVTIHQGVGVFPNLVSEFATNLRAFHDDMLVHMERVTVVVMSEFGRRVQENGAGGTDHGHGGAMYMLSPHLAPIPVHAQWPGMNTRFLDNGDLAITTDYRDVLAEVLTERAARTDLAHVFPGHRVAPVGLF